MTLPVFVDVSDITIATLRNDQKLNTEMLAKLETHSVEFNTRLSVYEQLRTLLGNFLELDVSLLYLMQKRLNLSIQH